MTNKPRFTAPLRRSGVAIILVLAIVAVSMGLAYTMLRSQIAEVQISTNSLAWADAQAAARAGMSIALGKMYRTGWAGVDTTLSGDLSSRDRYQVTFTTGDSSLTSGDADYAQYPFRVTLLSTGYSEDPSSQVTATYRVKAVVQLVRLAMPPEPADWTTAQPYTLFQRTNGGMTINVPMRVQGLVRAQGTLNLFYGLSWNSSSREQYLTDLNGMRTTGGYPDYRPFNGPIHIQNSTLTADNRQTIDSFLAIPRVDTPNYTYNDWSTTAPVTSYRLYPGGKSYPLQTLPAIVPSGTVLAPDPVTNPLGIRYRAGDVRLNSNVNIHGMIVTGAVGDLRIEGTNVRLTPVVLPALEGATQPVRLPTAVVADDFRVESGATGTATGLINVKDLFEFKGGPQAAAYGVTGRLVTSGFIVEPRDEGMMHNWNGLLSNFLLARVLDPLSYYPVWCKTVHGVEYIPPVTIVPDPTPVSYHWLEQNAPLFVPHVSDPGLRWDLIQWQDGV